MPDRYTYEDFNRKPPKRIKVKTKPRRVTDSHERAEIPKSQPKPTGRPSFFAPLPERKPSGRGALPSLKGLVKAYEKVSLSPGEITALLFGGNPKATKTGAEKLSDFYVGKKFANVLKGQERPDWRFGLEAAILPFPGKGLPTAATKAGRIAFGAKAGVEAARAGEGAAAVGRALDQPLLPKARQAGSSISRVAAAGAAKLGLPDPFVKFIANDPEAKRWFRYGGDAVWVRPARSRTGRLAEKAFDALRPRVSALQVKGHGILAKTPQEKYSQALGDTLHQSMRNSTAAVTMLQRTVGIGLLKKLKVQDLYALRMVGKGIAPDVAIKFHVDEAAKAAALGDTLGRRLHEQHAALFRDAARLVNVTDGGISFSDQASRRLLETYERMARAAEGREEILNNLGLLSEGEAQRRIVNEELLYHGARYQSTEKYVQSTIANDPNRMKLEAILRDVAPAQADDLLAVTDALARNLYDRETARQIWKLEMAERGIAEGGPHLNDFIYLRDLTKRKLAEGVHPAMYYQSMEDIVQGFPDEIKRVMFERYGTDIAFKFDTPELAKVARKAPSNLRAKLNPRNANRGLQVNPSVRRESMVVTGKISPQQWVKRVEKVMPELEHRDYWAHWYEHFEPAFREAFGADADAIMRGFALSQANTPPSSGLNAVLKVMDRIRNGEKVTSEGIGMIAHAIEQAVKGMPLERGAAAKLSDFMDSLALSSTRGWMGHMPEGGMPAAADVWAARDLGYVDKKYAGKLEKRFGLKTGTDFVVDSPGAPTGNRYERISEQYAAIADHLNAVKFDGRSDWNPAQVQALGWATVQRMVGTEPEDLAFALGRNMRRVDFEVTHGVTGIGNDLTLEQTQAVQRALEPELRQLIENTPGVYMRSIEHGLSGWNGELNSSMHASVIGSEKDIQKLVTRVAQAFDQELVQASRTVAQKTARAAVVIGAPQFEDPAVLGAFFKRLNELDPRLEGFMPGELNGEPAMVIRTTSPYFSPKTAEAFLSRYEAAVRQVEAELGLDVGYSGRNVELLIGGQRGAEDSLSRAGSVGAGSLDDPLAAAIRGRLEAAVDAARRGEDPTEALRGGEVGGLHPSLAGSVPEREGAEGAGAGAQGAGLGEDVAGAAGARIAAGLPGYKEAAAQLEADTLPVEFLRELVANPDLSHYEKISVARHLDEVSGGALLRGAADWEKHVPGLNEILPSKLVLSGLYSSGAHKLYLGSTATVGTVWHELTHMMQFEGIFPSDFMMQMERFLKIPKGEWSAQNYEDLAHLMEAFILGYDPTRVPVSGAERLPVALRDALNNMKRSLLESNAIDRDNARYLATGERAIPDEIKDAIDGLMTYRELTGKGFHGAEGYMGRGQVYMPETPGLPVSFLKSWSLSKAYATRFGSMLRRGQASHLRAVDKHLEKVFTGALIRSGRFDRDIIRGTVDVQMKAARLNAMHEVRQRALKLGKAVPERDDDVAVPVDLAAWKKDPKAKELRTLGALFDSLQAGGKIRGKELGELDVKTLEDITDHAFPGITKNTKDETEQIAREIIEGIEDPIENVVWVNRRALLDTGLFDERLFKNWNPVRRGAEWSVDAVNDYMKAQILLLNPAYYPMNIIGNGVMLLMQQGPLAPLNIMRAAKTHWDLGDDAFLIDHYVGGGLVSPATLKGAFVTGKVSTLLQDVANLIVDRYPRRAAFIYEARKLGFKGSDDVRELLTNPAYSDQLRIVSQRAKDAMVDFDNLSDFEREFMSKYIFVYPWLKGATQWTFRFPKDHPAQAAAYALLYAWQQNELEEEFPGGRPDYMHNFFPLGEVERYGKTVPFGISGRQVFTASTPLDILQTLQGWATGSASTQQLAEMFQPFYGELAKQATGYDTFKHEEVKRGIVAGFKRIFGTENMPFVKSLQQATRSEKQRAAEAADRLYPRNATEDWLKVFFGSLAPTPVNPETAGKISHQGPQSAESRLETWAEEAEKALGRPIPEQVKQLKLSNMRYDKNLSQVKRELGKDRLADNEILVARIDTFAQAYPDRAADAARWREEALKMNPAAAKPYLDQFAKLLGWAELREWEKAVEKMQEAGRG